MTKKDVKLKIKSVQRSGIPGDKDEQLEILTDAVINASKEKISVEYDELLSDDGAPTRTVLLFEREKPETVFLSRNGDVKMTCVIEEKTRYRFTYDIGVAALELVCVGQSVKNELSDNGGKLSVKYDREARGVTVQSCELSVTAS